MLEYAKPERISLKNHPEFNEKWLQDLIAEDPSILGLGDVELLDRERQQDRAGRLDLLLADYEANRRCEAEIMLGPTDESHIIRCIEYWDIERRRYPAYEHVAVLVAEDVTARFLNVLSLVAGSTPMVAIQLSAPRVGDKIVLDFVKVLDQTALREDDERVASQPAKDRAYWGQRTSPEIVKLADEALGIINERAKIKQQMNYKKHFIGLTDGIQSRNFVYFQPRKTWLAIAARVDDPADWVRRLKEGGFEADLWSDRAWTYIGRQEVAASRKLLTEFLHAAVERVERE